LNTCATGTLVGRGLAADERRQLGDAQFDVVERGLQSGFRGWPVDG
jgi:hypothetical protein